METMTVPSWLIVGIATIFCVVAWWGIREIVEANKKTSESIGEITKLLGAIDGRLAVSETWQKMHEDKDDERHTEMKGAQEAIWKVLEGIRT